MVDLGLRLSHVELVGSRGEKRVRIFQWRIVVLAWPRSIGEIMNDSTHSEMTSNSVSTVGKRPGGRCRSSGCCIQ